MQKIDDYISLLFHNRKSNRPNCYFIINVIFNMSAVNENTLDMRDKCLTLFEAGGGVQHPP